MFEVMKSHLTPTRAVQVGMGFVVGTQAGGMIQLQPHRNSNGGPSFAQSDYLQHTHLYSMLTLSIFQSCRCNNVEFTYACNHSKSSMLYGVLIYIANAGCASTNIG